MLDGSGCGGGLGTSPCGGDETTVGASGAGDVWWAQRSQGRTVRLQYDLGPAASFSGSSVSSSSFASVRRVGTSVPPTITTFSYADGVLTWDTSGGVAFLTSSTTGETWSVEPSGTMQALAGTTYTLTVRNKDGIITTGTAIVPGQADGLVIVDSVGNVYAITPNGPLWDAAWCGTAPFFGASVPTAGSSLGGYIKRVDEYPSVDGWRGVLDSLDLNYSIGDAWNAVPATDYGDLTAQGDPANLVQDEDGPWTWTTARSDISIGTGLCWIAYREFGEDGYEGAGGQLVSILGSLDFDDWRYYDANILDLSLGARLCVVAWSEAPYVGLVDVLTVGGTTANLKILEAGVDPNWAINQSVTVPDIGSWGVTRVEPTWWRGGSILGNQLFYY
jgi:hypothetical protein